MHKLNWMADYKEKEIADIYNIFQKILVSKAYPCTKGKFQIPISIEPFLIQEEEYRKLQEKIKIFFNAVKKVVDEYYINPILQQIISIHPSEAKLIELAQNQNMSGIIRLDMFYSDQPKIIEINSDFPDGFFMHDVTYQEISGYIKEYKGIKMSEKHSALFNELLLSQGVSKDQFIFIAYENERTFIDEFILCRDSLREHGWLNVEVGFFSDLECEANDIYIKGRKVDVIRRGAELSKVRKIASFTDFFCNTSNSELKMINNFKMRLFGHKAILAILYSKQFQYLFTNEEVEVIRELLPETLDLNKETVDFALSKKDKWVLKPADLTEGQEIIFGNTKTQSEWNESIKHCVYKDSKKWVLQEKITIPSAMFTVFNKEKGLVSQIKKHDFCPHIVLAGNDTYFGNILVRFSEQDILNVMQGGGITYAYPYVN